MEQSSNGDITASVDFVECEGDRETFLATYDTGCEPASLAIVAVVSTALGTDPLALTPLHTAIDTDALENLFSGTCDGHDRQGSVSFHYEGFDISVSSAGTIELEPIEAQ